MRVAIVHYWFLVAGGGERVVEALAQLYPEADIFALFADEKTVPPGVRSHTLHTSFLDRSQRLRKLNRAVYPLFPLAIESFDLRDYDLIITSDSPPMKGAIVRPDQMHICYCHTPGRYLWDYYSTFLESLPWFAKPAFRITTDYLRRWDYAAAQRVDGFVANSHYVHDRIQRFYGRESTVIYPPVDTAHGYISDHVDDAYIHVGRLVDSKRIELLIEACNRLERRLLIVGTGREEERLKKLAGPTVEFLGRVPEERLPQLYAEARALLFAADEDFGIVPLEAQAYGRPVLAYAKGGSLETVRGLEHDYPTGVFFNEQTVDSICAAIKEFEASEHRFNPHRIRAHARNFDRQVFMTRMDQYVQQSFERVPHLQLA
jgi:glycosyltransferase involved in cell wall biosynthesis